MSELNELIIAHRGESFDAPENTLAAINLAWERGVNSVEIDIRLTRDSEIVVIHDSNTKRVSGKWKIIRKSSLEELKQLNVGNHKGGDWKNEPIPTLNEVLKTVPEDGRLIIEIKSDERILEKLKQALDSSSLESSQIELIGYNANTLARAKQMMPSYTMLWILDLDYFWPHWIIRINMQRIIGRVKKLNLDGIDVWAGKLLTRNFIEIFKENGLFVYAWTVDSPEKAKLLIMNGIDGITTNRPSWLAKQLQKKL